MFSLDLPEGTLIIGEWNGRVYRVIRLLGEGAYGQVYLVTCRHKFIALKIGYDEFDLQSEINALKALSITRKKNDSYLLDADNFNWDGKRYPFYTMKFVQGKRVDQFVNEQGLEWVLLIGFRLLKQLQELHQHRYIFGDLKKDNVMIREHAGVELVDFGGATSFGKAVKQFTEIYDRGYWRAGSRIADEGYDLFSFAVLMVLLLDTHKRIAATIQLPEGRRNVNSLLAITSELQVPQEAKTLLQKCFKGSYRSSNEALSDWRRLMLAGVRKHRPMYRPLRWLSLWFVASALLLIAAVYVTFH